VKRSLLLATFVSLLLTVVVGVHVYLARRLIFDLELPANLRGGLLVGLIGLAATLVVQPIAQRQWGRAATQLVSWPAALWMGFAFLLLVTLTGSDLLWWMAARTALADVSGVQSATVAARMRAFSVVGFSLVVGLTAVRLALRPPAVRRVELRLARWPRALDGYRIVQISDVHIGPLLGRRFAADIVARCRTLRPNLLAVTGDLVDGSVAQLADEVAPFAALHAPDGVFFVTGNHDYFSGARAWVEAVQGLGWRVLRNERVVIEANGAAFELAGVDDHQGGALVGELGEDLPTALTGRTPSRPLVLLAHDPATFQQASQMGIDLQLSGHTHGGQIWPFRYLVRLYTPFVAGVHERNGAQLYVSCGTGFWGPPMRLFAPAEITELVLRAA